MDENKNTICPSCNSVIVGKYCPACGEKRVSAHDFSLGHFIEESIEGFTHFDNKFFRSIKILRTRPGLLSRYHSEGRRVRYMKPFQLFIISNILLFLILGKQNPFSISLSAYQYYKPYIFFNTAEIINQKAGTGEAFRHNVSLFNERMATASKAFIVFFIPALALFAFAVFINKKKYFSEHLVFVTHIFSFIVYYYILIYLLLQWPFYYFSGNNYNSFFDQITVLVNLVVIAVYFSMASYTFYNVKKWHAALAGTCAAFIFFITLFAYRMLLFYKLVYSLD